MANIWQQIFFDIFDDNMQLWGVVNNWWSNLAWLRGVRQHPWDLTTPLSHSHSGCSTPDICSHFTFLSGHPGQKIVEYQTPPTPPQAKFSQLSLDKIKVTPLLLLILQYWSQIERLCNERLLIINFRPPSRVLIKAPLLLRNEWWQVTPSPHLGNSCFEIC